MGDNNLLVNKSLKSIFLLVFLLTFFSIHLISAAEIQFIKESDSFSQGETIIAKVQGNFIDSVTRDNVFFYRGHVRIPMNYDVGKINNEIYIYALLTGKSPGNYSIAIENVKYIEGMELSEEPIISNFIITEDTADFYVTPGFSISIENFFLDIQNLLTGPINVAVTSSEKLISENSFNLISGEIKRINFIVNEGIENLNSFSEIISLKSNSTEYLVPIYVLIEEKEPIEEPGNGGGNGDNETTNGEKNGDNGDIGDGDNGDIGNGETNGEIPAKKKDFKFEPIVVEVSLATDTNTKRIIYLLNTGEDEIKDITFSIPTSLSPYVILPKKINSLKINAAEKIEIEVISDDKEKFIEGEIEAKSENITTSFFLKINFIENYIPPEDEKEETIIVTTCAQLNGKICPQDETCTGETASVKDGVCCLPPAKCEVIKKSGTGKIIGWSIIIFIILFLLWFFKKKYAGVQRKTLFKPRIR